MPWLWKEQENWRGFLGLVPGPVRGLRNMYLLSVMGGARICRFRCWVYAHKLITSWKEGEKSLVKTGFQNITADNRLYNRIMFEWVVKNDCFIWWAVGFFPLFYGWFTPSNSLPPCLAFHSHCLKFGMTFPYISRHYTVLTEGNIWTCSRGAWVANGLASKRLFTCSCQAGEIRVCCACREAQSGLPHPDRLQICEGRGGDCAAILWPPPPPPHIHICSIHSGPMVLIALECMKRAFAVRHKELIWTYLPLDASRLVCSVLNCHVSVRRIFLKIKSMPCPSDSTEMWPSCSPASMQKSHGDACGTELGEYLVRAPIIFLQYLPGEWTTGSHGGGSWNLLRFVVISQLVFVL